MLRVALWSYILTATLTPNRFASMIPNAEYRMDNFLKLRSFHVNATPDVRNDDEEYDIDEGQITTMGNKVATAYGNNFAKTALGNEYYYIVKCLEIFNIFYVVV